MYNIKSLKRKQCHLKVKVFLYFIKNFFNNSNTAIYGKLIKLNN